MLFHTDAEPELLEEGEEELEEKRSEPANASGSPADQEAELEPPNRSDPGDLDGFNPPGEPLDYGSRNTQRAPSSRKARARGARENEVVTILGKKGMGKTTYALGIFRARVRAGGSAIWIDRTGKAGAELEAGGFARTVDTVRGFNRELLGSLERGEPLRVAVNLGWGEDHNPLWRRIYQFGRVLLVLDDPSSLMKYNRIDPDLEELVELGRNQEVDIVTTVRRPPELHGSLKNATDVAVTFRQGTPHYAREVAGTWFHSLQDAESRILELPKFHYLRADSDGRISGGRVSI